MALSLYNEGPGYHQNRFWTRIGTGNTIQKVSMCSRSGLRGVHARVVVAAAAAAAAVGGAAGVATAVGALQMFPKDGGEISVQNVFVRRGDARLDVLGDLPLLVGVWRCAGYASRCLVCH